MRPPCTADERERRCVEYLVTLHRGQLAEFKLTRLNRIANFRKRLMDLLEEMIETRAEDLAAGMLMEYAPPRPKKPEITVAKNRLPLPIRKRRTPVWVRESSSALSRKS
jgi:hypothetical protein